MSTSNQIGKYTVQLPALSQDSLKGQETAYSVRVPSTKVIKNAFVTYDGLVLKNGMLEKYCAVNLVSRSDHRYYFPFWKKTLEQFLVCKYGKSLKSKQLSEDTAYLVIHSKWFNYSFWVNTYLPRLVMALDAFPGEKKKLIYCASWDKYPFVKESLQAFDIDMEVIEEDTHLFVPKLIFPECRETTGRVYPPILRRTKKLLLDFASDLNLTVPRDKYIYLSRKSRGVRTIVNEGDLQPLLDELGFKTHCFEDYNFWEQVVLMANAKEFISVHGAGFVNAIFMNEKAKALEIMEYDFAHYANPFPHRSLCSAVNVHYDLFLGKNEETKYIALKGIRDTTDQQRMKMVNRNVEVDPEAFDSFVKRFRDLVSVNE